MQITYTTHEGQEAVVYPSPDALALYGWQFIALKDVPAGVPFQIDGVEAGIGGDFGEGSTRDVVAVARDGDECWVRVKDSIAGEESEVRII